MDAEGQEQGNEDVDMHFVGNLELHDALGSIEPTIDDEVSHLLLTQMGSCGRSYKRESAQAAKRIVSEIYSPP